MAAKRLADVFQVGKHEMPSAARIRTVFSSASNNVTAPIIILLARSVRAVVG